MSPSFRPSGGARKVVLQVAASLALAGCLSTAEVDCCKPTPERSLIEVRYDALRELEQSTFEESRSDRERVALLSAYHQAHINQAVSPGSEGGVADGDLMLLFRATQLVAFYSRDGQHVDSLLRLLEALESRGLADQTHYREAITALVSTRRFETARQLLVDHPIEKMGPLPALLDAGLTAGEPSLLEVAEDNVLRRRKVDWTESGSIIVVAHPSCRFTQAAAEDIDADPELRELFASHGQWIAPQDHTVDFDVFRSWNHANPRAKISVSYRNSEFRQIDDWGTPTFYFVKGGRVIDKIVGWPGRERGEELIAAYQRLAGDAAGREAE